jgi:hypothetical protein
LQPAQSRTNCATYCAMPKVDDSLETLFAKVRSLPKEQQARAIDALSEIVETEVYELSEDERAILEPALERAKRGDIASEAEVNEALDKPWS